MDRRARKLARNCDACGVEFHRANLVALKDGRRVCSDCLTAILERAFA